MERKEIENRDDIIRLVDQFYKYVRNDQLIGPIFDAKIKNHWSTHLQKLYDFWESRLFGNDVYAGRPLMVHKNLPIASEHFNRWIKLWHQTIDEMFVGKKAGEAKEKATSIGDFFQKKMDEMKG